MKLRYSPRAVQDLSDIADYLLPRSPRAAAKVRDSLIQALSELTRFPFAGRAQQVAEVRKLVTLPYRYLVYYTVELEAEEIWILSIQHPARDREHEDA